MNNNIKETKKQRDERGFRNMIEVEEEYRANPSVHLSDVRAVGIELKQSELKKIAEEYGWKRRGPYSKNGVHFYKLKH